MQNHRSGVCSIEPAEQRNNKHKDKPRRRKIISKELYLHLILLFYKEPY